MYVDYRGARPPQGPTMNPLTPDDDRPIGHVGAFARKRALVDLPLDARRLGRCVAVSACFVVAWSLIEVPWEIDLAGSATGAAMTSGEEIAAVLASKTLLFVIAGLALTGRRVAKYVLLFICLMSVLAMAPEIPVEYGHSPWLAMLSGVECIGKLATFAFLALDLRLKRD
jgi:hypothetical protein